jgi:hypothetical protein
LPLNMHESEIHCPNNLVALSLLWFYGIPVVNMLI